MKSRRFYLLYSMSMGGVEKAFLGHLSTIDFTKTEVHVGLFFKKGVLLDRLPPEVIVHWIRDYDKYWSYINNPPQLTLSRAFKTHNIINGIILFVIFAGCKILGSRMLLFNYISRTIPSLKETFDEAYAFAGPSSLIDYYICKKTTAKKKYGWVHFDISHFGIDRGLTRRLYRQYERIYVVSKETRDIFGQVFPEFTDKTEVLYNVINPTIVRALADNGPSFSDGYFGKRILTVGRISKEKGQLLAIQALEHLLKKSPHVRWYFVGEGKDQDALQALVSQGNMENSAVFLGLQENPYGFMRDCDLYVQPSRHEGYCITLAEALCFNKPIVATGFSGAREQLEGKADAWIADFTPESLADSIHSALSSLA